jgi:hypothetical protein
MIRFDFRAARPVSLSGDYLMLPSSLEGRDASSPRYLDATWCGVSASTTFDPTLTSSFRDRRD